MIAAGAFTTWLGAAGSAVVAGAINGAIIGAAVGAVSSAINGTNILDGMGKGAVTGAVTGAVVGGVSHAFNAAGGGTIPEGTDVSQVGTGTEAGAQVIAPQAAPVETAGGVIQPPTAPAGVSPPSAVPTDSQYLLGIEKMGKDAFYREAVSGAVQAGAGAYASKEEAKAKLEAERAAIEADKPAGVLKRDYVAPTISPAYAATRPRVEAPIAARPTAVQVGVERPTADIRNISVQRGVLPNG